MAKVEDLVVNVEVKSNLSDRLSEIQVAYERGMISASDAQAVLESLKVKMFEQAPVPDENDRMPAPTGEKPKDLWPKPWVRCFRDVVADKFLLLCDRGHTVEVTATAMAATASSVALSAFRSEGGHTRGTSPSTSLPAQCPTCASLPTPKPKGRRYALDAD